MMFCYKALYSAQLLYITSIPIFGQHHEIEALISEFEVRRAIWNVLTPEKRDLEKKRCLEQKYISTVFHCLYAVDKLLDVNNVLAILLKVVPFKCNKFYLSAFLQYLGLHFN